MRLAVVSDIHGNRAAFEAVLADLRETAPDLVLHGGDLAGAGACPCEVIDRIRDLGWPGVVGNTDEMLFDPASLESFAHAAPHLSGLFEAIREIAAADRDALGAQRLEWLGALPRIYVKEGLALLHASASSPWRSPLDSASDADLTQAYGALGQPLVVYGHIHRPFVRGLQGLTVVNSGSAGLPYDGDPRACYLLLDNWQPSIRRVPYNLERELKTLRESGRPQADWVARILASASPQMP